MTELKSILVDTNVILDVTEQDENWADWSQDQMGQYVDLMVINPLIYSELCYEANNVDQINSLMLALGLRFEELSRDSLYLASQAFKRYRDRGGVKTAPLADFFIGAHALAMNMRILTRDVQRYGSYFPEVELISPED